MFIIAGLGNPGTDYEHTRHNAGFDTIDLLAERVGVSYWKDACGSKLAEAKLRLSDGSQEDIVLVKPQSFMNLSGGPLKKVLETYGVTPQNLIVVHDELDIAPGSIRVKFGGGHAGHNGLRSIVDKTQTKDFYRVRVGVGRPPGRMPVADYVLSRPVKTQAEDMNQALMLAADAVESLIANGLAKTQQTYN